MSPAGSKAGRAVGWLAMTADSVCRQPNRDQGWNREGCSQHFLLTKLLPPPAAVADGGSVAAGPDENHHSPQRLPPGTHGGADGSSGGHLAELKRVLQKRGLSESGRQPAVLDARRAVEAVELQAAVAVDGDSVMLKSAAGRRWAVETALAGESAGSDLIIRSGDRLVLRVRPLSPRAPEVFHVRAKQLALSTIAGRRGTGVAEKASFSRWMASVSRPTDDCTLRATARPHR